MPAGKYDITAEQGSTFGLNLNYKDDDDNPISLTGYNARMQVRRNYTTSEMLLSGDAHKRIEKSSLSELIITDTIPVESKSRKVKILSCSQLFASTMKNVHLNKSIDKNFLN